MLIDHALRDIRYAIRVLRTSPGFTLVAVLSLALGIGANTAIFELIDAVRLRRLPVPRAEELADVRIAGGNRGWGLVENANSQLTYPLWKQIQQEQRAFSGIFAWGTTPFLVGIGPDARVLRGLWVSGDAFPVLGVKPALGRLMNPADDQRGCPPVVVLSHAFWQAELGGDPAAIGRTLTILDRPVPVIGVTAPAFFGLEVGKQSLLTTENDPLHLELRTDWPVLAFTAAAGILTCVVFGLVPALRASRMDPGAAMKSGGRGLTASRERMAIHRCLAVAQVTVSLVLMFGAILFARSFRNLVTLDTGFERDGVVLARFGDFSDRPTSERLLADESELLARIRSIPQVSAAAATTKLPLDGSSWTLAFVVNASGGVERHSSKFTYVSPRYFGTVGMRLLAGRDFDGGDTARSRKVAASRVTTYT